MEDEKNIAKFRIVGCRSGLIFASELIANQADSECIQDLMMTLRIT